MIKLLVPVLIVSASALGVQSYIGQRGALQKAQAQAASIAEQQAAQPTSLLAFELDQGGDKKFATADLCGSEVALLYLYSDSKRDPAIEKNLAAIAKEKSGKVRVVPVRDAASTGKTPEQIEKLGTPVTDTKGALAAGYRVKTLPAVVVLKNRPVYHAGLSTDTAKTEQLEATVDALVARDDLTPMEGGCGGGECGGGGCMGEMMLKGGPAGGCSH